MWDRILHPNMYKYDSGFPWAESSQFQNRVVLGKPGRMVGLLLGTQMFTWAAVFSLLFMPGIRIIIDCISK